jgi:hypothetical protein
MRNLFVLIVAASLAAAGCKSFETPSFLKSEKAKAREVTLATPVRMAVVWTEAVMNNHGQAPVRGFGGRVYFYNDEGKAVAAKGQFVVYAFDDSRRDETSHRPERKFAYTAEQFAKYETQSPLGPSFNVWIPWDAAGGEQRELSLLPVFTTSTGQVLAGEQTVNVLQRKDGNSDERGGKPALSRYSQDGNVRQVGHYESSDESNGGEGSVHDMRTMTITIPKTLAERMSISNPGAATMPAVQPRELPAAGALPNQTGTEKKFTAPPWTPADPRPTRFVRPRSQALGEPLVRPRPVHAPTAPFPAGPPSGHPSPGSPGPVSETEGSWPGGPGTWQPPRG